MKKRPLTYTVLAAAAMISLGVGASLAQGGNAGGGSGGGGGGGGGAVTDTVAPVPPPVDPIVVAPVDPAAVPAAQTPPPPPPPVVLPTADVQLGARASTGSPAPGSSYTFTYTVKNSGPGTAEGIVFRDEVAVGNAQWTLNGTTNSDACQREGFDPTVRSGGFTLVCSVPTLAKGQSATIAILMIAPEVAATVANTGAVSSTMFTDSNPANNTASASITVKAPTGSVCKGGTCDLVPSVQATPCARLTAVSAPVGYYLTYAAIWNVFTLQSCSSGSETVSIQVQELNQLTGLVDYNVTWYVTLSPSQNYSMVLDNDFAPNDTPYTISYTVRDSSGNQLDISSLVATTPPPN